MTRQDCVASTRGPARYSCRIIKAGALLDDTKALLANWDLTADVATNLARVRSLNLLGKVSRSRVRIVLGIFRHRYLVDPGVLTALVRLAQSPIGAESLDSLLYFLTAQSDPLLHDAVLQVLAPLSRRGLVEPEVRVADMEEWIAGKVAEAPTSQGAPARGWSATTIERVAQGLLSTLRDFGMLDGAVKKRLAPRPLPLDAFALLALLLYRRQPSGQRLLHDPEWRLFLLDTPAVERLFLQAHRDQLLEYYASGHVVRVDFPVATLEEYAYALAQRSRRPAGERPQGGPVQDQHIP